jgi:adenylosuccinate lyase
MNTTDTAAPAPSIAEVAGGARRFTDYAIPDPGIRELYSETSAWSSWLAVEAALADAQAELGLIPEDAARVIRKAVAGEGIDVARVRRGIARTQHPLIPLVEELNRLCGEEAGRYVHWGATTQNITQTGNNLLHRRAHGILMALLADCMDGAGRLAADEADSVMPGRTHGQHAVPTTFGFKAAGWIDEMLRDADRLERSGAGIAKTMMGGAIGTYAAMGEQGPAVQAGVADRLGMPPMSLPARNILDQDADHVWSISMAAATGARISRDIMTLMQTEFSEVREPAEDTSIGSSTMPQKRNPKLTYNVIEIAAEIRSKLSLVSEARIHAHEADGSSTALVDGALQEVTILLGDLLVRLRTILNGLEVDRGRMRSNAEADGGLISAEAVMIELGEDVGRQRAHEIVREAAVAAVERREPFRKVLARDVVLADRISGERLDALLDPGSHTGLSAEIARDFGRRAHHAARRIRDRLGA